MGSTRYEHPTFEYLQRAVRGLNTNYIGSNGARINSILLIQSLVGKGVIESPESIRLISGLLINALMDVDEEYCSGKSRRKSYSLWGSTYSDILSEALNHTKKNKLDNYTKLKDLNTVYRHIEKINQKFPGYKNKDEFITKIKENLKKVIAKSESQIDPLFQRGPSAEALRDSFKKLPDSYEKQKKKSTETREPFLQFLRAVDRQCEKDDLDNKYVERQDSHSTIKEKSLGYLLRYSAVLYIMGQIEDEYRLTSPENSELYKQCQKAINLNNTQNLKAIQRENYYWLLGSLIPKIDRNDKTPCSWTSEQFPYANDFFLKMQVPLLKKLQQSCSEVANADPNPRIHKLRKAVNSFISSVFNVGLCALTGALVEIPVGSQIFSKALGMLGHARYGYPGKVMGQQIGNQMERGLLSATVSKGVRTAASQSNFISEVPGEIVYQPLSFFARFANSIYNYFYPNKDNPFECNEAVNILTSLPDDVYSADKKERLRTIEPYPSTQTPAVEQEHVATFGLGS